MKNFGIKLIDIMFGVILGLGFQWWPNLSQLWQYVAFIFIYIDIIDYWIDYNPTLKEFPPKRELDIILDVALIFSLFLYIYSAQLTIVNLLITFALFKLFDFFWILRAKFQYKPIGIDRLYLNTWFNFDLIEIFMALLLISSAIWFSFAPLIILTLFIILRVILRIFASLQYKKVYFA